MLDSCIIFLGFKLKTNINTCFLGEFHGLTNTGWTGIRIPVQPFNFKTTVNTIIHVLCMISMVWHCKIPTPILMTLEDN